MDLDAIFAYVVGTLAALAIVGALVFALVWEVCAIRRTLAARHLPPPPTWGRERGATAAGSPGRKWS